jgi:PmbA protein
MLDQRELRALAEQVLDLSAADETEVLLLGRATRLTRFANNYIHQNTAETGLQIRVRAALGQRVGVAATDDSTPDGLRSVVERAVGLARLQADDPYFPGLPAPDGQVLPTDLGYVTATAGYTAEERARAVAVVCSAAATAKQVSAGAFETGEQTVSVANSHGLWRYHHSTCANLSMVVMGPTGSGWGSAAASDVGEIDAQVVAGEAVQIAARAQDPIELEPGEYPVVLAPDAVGDILDYLGYVSFNGLAVLEGRSFLSTRMGQQVMAPSVSIWDDGQDPTGLPLPFDYEGVSKQRVSLIQDGIGRGVVWDRRSALKLGEGHSSTGHAEIRYGNIGVGPAHLFMAPGQTAQAELPKGIERGIWITRFWYTRVVHPLEVVMTGMTRDGTFLIENGQITRPVRNLRFTQSYLKALAEVDAISRETRLIDGGGLSSVRAPAIRVRSFNFTGVSKE